MSFHKLPPSALADELRDLDDVNVSDSSSDENNGEEETWDDWIEKPVDQTPCPSLFDDDVLFQSVKDAMEHDKREFGFDLDAVCDRLSLDFYGRTRLVNYIRREKPSPTTMTRLTGQEPFFSSETYLLPVIEDDPLLYATETWSDEDDDDILTKGSSSTAHDVPSLERRVQNLERKLHQAKLDMAEYRKLVESRFGLSRLAEQMEAIPIADSVSGLKPRDDDSHYFNSYGDNDIHAVMIQDRVRTASYASFIYNNAALFKDAVVLDVGCGTGILSLFAARAGARRVFAVDASDIVDKAQQIVKDNRLEDIITVIKGKVEDITLPEDVTQVDIILSEWMGYALLYESMLDSVLRARDRFLKDEGGVMVPSQCKMMLGMCSAGEVFKERVGFWDDVYGFDLSAMAPEVYEEAIIDIVPPETLVSDVVVIKDLTLQTTSPSHLSFSSSFHLTSNTSRRTTTHAFILYFDTFFSPTGEAVKEGEGVKSVKDGEGILAEVWRPGRRGSEHGSGEGRASRSASVNPGTLSTSPTASDTITHPNATASPVSAPHVNGQSNPTRTPVRRKSSYGDGLVYAGGKNEKEKIVSFSTGPKSAPTHWKQTLFLLREPVVMQDGTTVSGTFHCRKNSSNSRELDVEIHYSVRHPGAEEESQVVVQTFLVR